MRIVADTREQRPFLFPSRTFPGVEVVRGTLSVGDYSLEGLEHQIAIERKSLPDLVQCLGVDRSRFVAEMMRARGMDAFCVICEGSYADLARGNYRSKLHPHSAVASVAAFMARLRIPFLFCSGRSEAEQATYQFLRQWCTGRCKELEFINAAIGQGVLTSQKADRRATR